MQPTVLHLIPCDDVQIDPINYHRCNVFGLITSIRSAASPPYPVLHRQFLVLVVWTGGLGSGQLTLRVVQDRSGNSIFNTRPRQVRFVGDPTAIGGVAFRILNCTFPAEGLYWVEVIFAGSTIARQQLILRT